MSTNVQSFKIYYQNVRGLKTKTVTFLNAVLSDNFDLIVITESWLNSSVENSEILDDRYTVFRSDRDYLNTGKSEGGGTLIAVKNTYFSTRAQHLETTLGELWIRILIGAETFYVCATYIPPTGRLNEYEIFCNNIINHSELLLRKNLLIIGDFNIPMLYPNNPNRLLSRIEREFQVFVNLMNLTQFNSILNENNRILDYILSNVHVSVHRSENPLVPLDKHHPALECFLQCEKAVNVRPVYNQQYNFAKGDFLHLYYLLKNTDWEILKQYKNTDEAVNKFYELFYHALDNSVPKTVSCTSNFPPWFTYSIKRDINKKSRIRKKLKLNNNDENLAREFKNIRKKIKKDINLAYINYCSLIENGIKTDAKKFWSFLKSKKKSNFVSYRMYLNGDYLETNSEIANAFAVNFESVYYINQNMQQDNNYLSENNISLFNIGQITAEEVEHALKSCKSKKSVGFDDIPVYIYKACSEFLSEPIATVFNLCVTNCEYPEKWKISKVCPIFKNGDKNDITNYRPISLLQSISKVFEKVLYDKIFHQIKPMIINEQHGFMPRRSINTNLITFTQDLADALDKNKQIDVVYTDFAKAFDRVNHKILLNKLPKFGFNPSLIKLLESYLTNRWQIVVFNGSMSEKYKAISGVPQGAVLGPLLFLLFINDLPEVVKSSEYALFADDFKMWRVINSETDCDLLQQDISNIFQWSQNNLLFFNISKCCQVSFTKKLKPINFQYTMNNNPLTLKEMVSDLGILFDNKLTFKNHIQKVANDSFKILGFIIRNSHNFREKLTLTTLYNSYVRSKLEFGAIIWSPFYKRQIKQIEKVQTKFIRYLDYKMSGVYPNLISYRHLLNTYDIDSLEMRRQLAGVIFLYQVIHYKVESCEKFLSKINFMVPKLSSRDKLLFYLSTPRTNICINSPLFRICTIINKLVSSTVDIFHPVFSNFKISCRVALRETL